MAFYLLGLRGRLRASPKSVSESRNPPLPCGIALTYLQPNDGFPTGVALPKPTGMSSRPIICKTSYTTSIVAAFAQPVPLTNIPC